MGGTLYESGSAPTIAVNRRLAAVAHLQAIKGSPLSAEEIAVFEIFERERRSPERRRAHIVAGSRTAITSPRPNERRRPRRQ